MENPSDTDTPPSPFRWTRTPAEVIKDRAERSANRKGMLLDMAGFALAVYASEETDPLARQVKKRVIGRKLDAASRWRRLLGGR